MKVCKIDGKYYVPFINGKYYAISSTGGDAPDIPDVPDEPDVPTVQYNVELVGDIVNNDGVLSNFDTDNYVILKDVQIDESSSSNEIVIGFTTSDDVTTAQGIFDTNAETSYSCWWLYLKNATLHFGMGRGSSANTSVLSFTGLYTIEPNTQYYFKFEWINKRTYQRFSISTDGGNTYVEVYSRNQSVGKYPYTQGKIALGMAGQDYQKYASSPCSHFLGTFNLNGDYIKENDEFIWEGVKNE